MSRINKIAESMKNELGIIIQNEIKDPRLPLMVSITNLKLTNDLKHAKIYISVLGTNEDKKNALTALVSATGFIKREIGNRVKMRCVPDMHFELDNSIEDGMHLTKLIDDVVKDIHKDDSEKKYFKD